MSSFLLPKSLCKKKFNLTAKFRRRDKKVHRCKWKELYKPKTLGGLGFKTFLEFNKAMLAKQVWRFHTEPRSLVARIFKTKFFPKFDILKAKLGLKPNYLWRIIFFASIEVINKATAG